MSRFVSWALLPTSLAVAMVAVSASGTEDLTGVWVLNVEKSTWGKMKVPASVIVDIDHKGSTIRYSGWVAYANEDTREFGFDGAIDGKEYP